MGRLPCCRKENFKKAAWSTDEDQKLINYVELHGERNWRKVAQNAGLNRCAKSCRLRWLNYLRPDIKIGNFTMDEDELIMELHRLHGNRWAFIAGRLPGRTDNEIKNYWKTVLAKKLKGQTPRSSLRQPRYVRRLTVDSPTPFDKPHSKKMMKAVPDCDEGSISLEDESQTAVNASAQSNHNCQSLESSTASFNNDSTNQDAQELFLADTFSSNVIQGENSGMQEPDDEYIENDIFSICRDTDISAACHYNGMMIYEFEPQSLDVQMKQWPSFLEIENEWRDLW